jgi:hypothetical protein
MAMMDADWEMSSAGTTFRGREKTFWSAKMTQIFSTGICYPSERGLRELVGTLYLLFCGDLLRKSIDKAYKTFSVPLASFVQCLLKPHEFDNQPQPLMMPNSREKGQLYRDAHVSFIQVTRNYLCFSAAEFYHQDFLRDLFESGTAFFVHPNFPEIDLVASVKLTTFGNVVSYVPLFVCFTTSIDIKKSDEDLLNSNLGGVRLKVRFDRSNKGYMSDVLTAEDLDSMLYGNTVSGTVIVPRDDPFVITDILTDTVWCGSERSEVYASHFQLYCYPLEEVNSANLIRKTNAEATLSYLNDLRKALLDVRENPNI